MFRTAILVAGLALAAVSLAHAQQPTTPPVPEDALTPRELIAWSSLQIPQPAQQQLPATQGRLGQDPARRPQQPIGAQERQEPAQSQNTDQPKHGIRVSETNNQQLKLR